MHVSFQSWTKQRNLLSVGTNAGAEVLPFQTWHHFKEAFALELVARAGRSGKASWKYTAAVICRDQAEAQRARGRERRAS